MPEIAIIFPSIIVMLIVIGISINAIVSKVYAHQRWERENENPSLGANTDQLADRTDMIEDRLRVLERIATDRGQLLSDEIETLRTSISHETNSEKA